MIKRLVFGLSCIPSAAKVLSEARLWGWILAPGILVSLLIPVIITVSWFYFGDYAIWLHQVLPEWAQMAWLSTILAALTWGAAALFAYFLGSQIILAIYAPLFGQLSERIEAHLGGTSGKTFTFKDFFVDIGRALVVLGLSLGKWMLWLFVAFLISWVPVVGAVASAVLFFSINAYFSALGSIDPCLERRSVSVRETFNYGRRERLGLVGLGSAYQLLLFIPIAGWVIAPGLLVAGCSLYCIQNDPRASAESIVS